MKEQDWVISGSISGSCKECEIYHLLRAAFGQCVTIAQIVHFNVFDIVTVLLVDLVIEGCWLRG